MKLSRNELERAVKGLPEFEKIAHDITRGLGADPFGVMKSSKISMPQRLVVSKTVKPELSPEQKAARRADNKAMARTRKLVRKRKKHGRS
jgi:hypothetical protein